jgi:hypothetical protein
MNLPAEIQHSTLTLFHRLGAGMGRIPRPEAERRLEKKSGPPRLIVH